MEIQLIYEQAALSFCLTKETTKTQEEDLPPDVQPTMIIRLTIHDRPFPFLIIADSLLYMPPIKINTAERILVIPRHHRTNNSFASSTPPINTHIHLSAHPFINCPLLHRPPKRLIRNPPFF